MSRKQSSTIIFTLIVFFGLSPLCGQFRASSSGSVKVRVLDSRSGEPIPGLSVGIEDQQAQMSRSCGETDQDGSIDLGISHGDYVLFISGNENYLGTMCKGRTGAFQVRLEAKEAVNAESERRKLENSINGILEAKGYGVIAYKLSKAIIWGGKAVDVAGAIVSKLPGMGMVISIPGVWEMNLRLHDEKLVWELRGSLVDAQFKYLSIFKLPGLSSGQPQRTF